MEVKMITLCESATRHPDGTFSLLRGGIDNWAAPQFPVTITCTVVVTIELSLSETGQLHTVGLDIVDEDGNRLLPQAKIQFSNPKTDEFTKLKNNIMGVINVPVKKPGQYSLDVSVDGVQLTSYEFRAILTPGSPT
jgi:hypothetical protein